MASDPLALGEAEPLVVSGLAQGRLRFNRADFWGSHEALEGAWLTAPSRVRPLLQGLIQAAAAFHKLVVQDNAVGADRLLLTALAKLDKYPIEALGLALEPFRAELHEWRRRARRWTGTSGPVVGLPRLEWSPSGLAERLDVDSVSLHLVERNGRRCILIAVGSGSLVGWGEARYPWSDFGAWECLVSGLAPALLSEPLTIPSELPLLWSEVGGSSHARAGLEAAVWDLWARRRGITLCAALGHEPRAVPILGEVQPGDISAMPGDVARAMESGYRQLLLPARPNADRRVLPDLVHDAGVPVAIDLGGAYRAADIAALRVLDDLPPTLLADPAPASDPAANGALARWLTSPVSLGGWSDTAHLAWAIAEGPPAAVHVEPSEAGLTEAMEMLQTAGASDVASWVRGRAVTWVGAATELSAACHPAATLPSVIAVAADEEAGRSPCPGLDEHGRAAPWPVPGSGAPAPEPQWLESTAAHTAVLRA